MSGILDAGRFAKRLQYQVRLETPDGCGGYDASWQSMFNIWAHVRPLASGADERAGTRESAVTHEIVLRKRAGLIAGARFQMSARVFDILSIHDPDETGRYLQCQCRELQ